MHRYASQTPEACELVSELEFVWDQIKYNASSSSSSSPMNAVGVPPLSRQQGSSYGSIGSRLAESAEDYERPDMRGDDRDSRLRVSSPVSQPEEEEDQRYRHADDTGPEATDDDEDEEYEEARDSLYENQEPEHDHASTNTDTRSGTGAPLPTATTVPTDIADINQSLVQAQAAIPRVIHIDLRNSPWRRRVELALTKMTAEIAAVREQMEARTLANRRRNGIWALAEVDCVDDFTSDPVGSRYAWCVVDLYAVTRGSPCRESVAFGLVRA